MLPLLQKPFHLGKKIIKVWRLFGIRGVFKGVIYKIQVAGISTIRLVRPLLPFFWEENYVVEDNSQVILYTDDDTLYPDYWPQRTLRENRPGRHLPVTVISTCKNEEDSSVQWLEALSRQTRQPEEIIVVDGGSRDHTTGLLKDTAGRLNLTLKILDAPDTNIAKARNLAIRSAVSPVIASLDFGCVPHDDWLEKIVAPFEIETKTEVSAGWYQASQENGKRNRFRGVPSLKDVFPQHFIPSSRSLAFTKKAWETAGGYPEWLTLTGEDTYFGLELKRYCPHWAFVPDAVVNWRAPRTWSQIWKKTVYWAAGDGEIGYNASGYRYALRRIVVSGLIAVFGIAAISWLFLLISQDWWATFVLLACAGLILLSFLGILSWLRERDILFIFGMFGMYLSQVAGFWKGARRRKVVSLNRFKQTKGLFFILAGVPIDDTGGGARSTQLALELLRQNFWVVYINRFPKYESQTVDFQIAHPNLMTFELADFDWENFVTHFRTLLPDINKYAVVEFPIADFLPLIEQIKLTNGKIVYEMIDDWNSSLGGSWYTEELEKEVVDKSDILIATAPILQQKMKRMSQRMVGLLPNAVNSLLFNPDRLYRRPPDLPDAKWIAMYIGALWGDWFDWDLLKTTAVRYPEAEIVVIGDYRGQCKNPPNNLRFLGLKAQSALPAYLAHADVTIIPWKVNAITQATSPLKLYEYLAMHRPVVAPDLNPLHGIPGVYLAKDTEEFIRLLGEVQKKKIPLDELQVFINKNNWRARILQLMEWLGQ